jgi:predicted membrane chloride channel (bestrophin family)
VKVLPLVLVILGLKLGLHEFGWEIISISSLFSSIISANIFLLGFLLAGTLSDYKESERLPGQLASSIETISDEIEITYKNKKAKEAKEAYKHLTTFLDTLHKWFYKKAETEELFDQLNGFNKYFLAFEKLTQPNFIVRLKQEQNALRNMITRVQTIRDTDFVSVGYAIAEITTFLLTIGFLFTKFEPFYESVFFVGVATFLMLYMIALIKDLDNPFDYYEGENEAAHVSLEPLVDVQKRLERRFRSLK